MWQVEPRVCHVPAAARVADAVQGVEDALRGEGRAAPVLLRLSENWLRWGILPWDPALASAAECQRRARALLADAWMLEDGGGAWEVAVDDAPWGEPRAVVAAPRELLDGLMAAVRALGVRQVAVEPLVSAIASARDVDGAFCVMDGAFLTFAIRRRGRLAAVFSTPRGDDPGQAAAYWHRIVMRNPGLAEGPCPLAMHTDDGMASASTVPLAPVFAPLPSALTRRAVVVALFACLALAGAVWFAHGAQVSRLALAGQLAERTAPPMVEPPLPVTRLAEVRAVNRAIRQLNVPVTALLRAVPPADGLGVSLLAIDISGGYGAEGGAVSRLEAQARTPEGMTGYIAQLTAHPAIAAVWLSHHEIARDEAGQPYRFTVEARWKEVVP